MKKSLILVVAGLVCVTGCGNKANKQVVCTGQETEDGVTIKAVVTASLKDDKVDGVKASMEFSDKDTATQYCSLFQLANSFAESEDEKMDFECKDEKIIFNDYSTMLSDNDESVVGLTRAEFIELAESQDLTCK